LGERLLCKQEVVGSIPSASRAGLVGLGLGWAALSWMRFLDRALGRRVTAVGRGLGF